MSKKKKQTVREFVRKARKQGHDSLGIVGDPEALEVLLKSSLKEAKMGKLSQREYKNLKNQLNDKELKEIEKLEKDCEDLSIGYFEFEREVESWMIGYWTPEKLRAALAMPISKLKSHLLYLAAELRNIKFNE